MQKLLGFVYTLTFIVMGKHSFLIVSTLLNQKHNTHFINIWIPVLPGSYPLCLSFFLGWGNEHYLRHSCGKGNEIVVIINSPLTIFYPLMKLQSPIPLSPSQTRSLDLAISQTPLVNNKVTFSTISPVPSQLFWLCPRRSHHPKYHQSIIKW